MRPLSLCWLLASLALFGCDRRPSEAPNDPEAFARCTARCDALGEGERPSCAKPGFSGPECEQALDLALADCRRSCQERHLPSAPPAAEP